MSAQPSTDSGHPPTFRKINAEKVFGCEGRILHVTPGEFLLKTGAGYLCPTCHTPVKDISHTLLGQSYWAFARTDLGKQ